MRISALHIANLFAYGHHLGIPETSLRKHLTVPEIDVCVSENTISAEAFLKVFQSVQEHSGHAYFGLYYGCYLNIKSLGLIAELSLATLSMEHAVHMIQQYLKVSFPLILVTTRTRGDYYELHIDTLVQDTVLRNQLLDVILCFMYRELRLMLAKGANIVVTHPHSDTTEYSGFLHTDVHGGREHKIILDRHVLTTAINQENTKTIAYLLPKFMLMFEEQPKGYQSFSLQVRQMILHMCCPEPPTFQQLAKQFPLSQRTIQRKLKQEKQSFRKIMNAIRMELSMHLNKAKWLKTKEISAVLGYSETSAYVHALKRWKMES